MYTIQYRGRGDDASASSRYRYPLSREYYVRL
jgi:hypothetical protein